MGRSTIHLRAAGSNGKGQLATGNFDDAHSFQLCIFAGYPPGSLPSGTTSIVTVVGGGNHTIVLLSRSDDDTQQESRELWGCGDGTKGQLGPEAGEATVTFRLVRLPLDDHGLAGYAVKAVAACWETSYVVLSKEGNSDVLISMGGDDYGDLGIGGAAKANGRGRKPFYIVDLVDAVGVQGQQISVKEIVAGPHHVVVHFGTVHPDGSTRECVAGWGASRHGQLGRLSSPNGRSMPFVASPHTVVHDRGPPGPIRAIRLGNQHTVFLHCSGDITALGSDRKNQIQALSDFSDATTTVGCTWNGTYILSARGGASGGPIIHSVGSHARGQLGRQHSSGHGPQPVEFPFAPSGRVLQQFACGSEHVLALFSKHGHHHATEVQRSGRAETEVWGWGWNEHGNLGTGSLEDIPLPVRIWPPSGEGLPFTGDLAISVWAGCGTSWIAFWRQDRSTTD